MWHERNAAVVSALRLVAILVEYGNDRVFQLLWDFSLAPDEGGKPMELQQDGPVLVRVLAVPREGHPAPLLSRLPSPSLLWQSPLPWARSRRHSRLDAAVASSGCRDRACRISRSATSGRIAPTFRGYVLCCAAVFLVTDAL